MWLGVCLTVFYHLGYDCCRKQALENLHIALSSTVILWIQVYLAVKLPWSCLHWADGNSIEVSWLGSELTWTIVTHQVWLIIKGLWVFPSCSQFYCTVWVPKKKKKKSSCQLMRKEQEKEHTDSCSPFTLLSPCFFSAIFPFFAISHPYSLRISLPSVIPTESKLLLSPIFQSWCPVDVSLIDLWWILSPRHARLFQQKCNAKSAYRHTT